MPQVSTLLPRKALKKKCAHLLCILASLTPWRAHHKICKLASPFANCLDDTMFVSAAQVSGVTAMAVYDLYGSAGAKCT